MPIQNRKRLFIDPGWYFLVADSVLRPLLPDSVNKKSALILLCEVPHAYPLLVLPRCLAGNVNNDRILHLSTDKQLNFRFFLEGGMRS